MADPGQHEACLMTDYLFELFQILMKKNKNVCTLIEGQTRMEVLYLETILFSSMLMNDKFMINYSPSIINTHLLTISDYLDCS